MLWEGTETAHKALGTLGGHRPELLAIRDAVEDGVVYRAELSEHLDAPVISPDPILRAPLDLAPEWWNDLRTVLGTVAGTTTDRIAVRHEYIERTLPEFLGLLAPKTIEWATAHGDLHWANLTSPLRILDW
ncbi:hypothetical protein ABZ442_15040 [Streptomyces triculaminicus]|uniref:hypothetical protein n=1 Tax=Streptomyces triculaminicus TaxID=2816232 RepID=UPI0033F5622E